MELDVYWRSDLGWLLLFLPLFSAITHLIWLHREPFLSQVVSISACTISFFIAVGLFAGSIPAPNSLLWLNLSDLQINIGWLDNALSRAMLLVVTGIGLLVHLFSIGYMDHDSGRGRFFGQLSLFMFSMLGIVIADNLIQMYIFWELVGLSSYLLIGFWFTKPAASSAAKKAFLCNRVGDFGFLLGILFYWQTTGTLSLAEPEAVRSAFTALDNPGFLTAISLLLFCGCIGKSAMFPLHVWLPDAMEGPTPVSALIHAATMVAAGIYMLCRLFFVLELSPDALLVIAYIGGFMTLFAALIACQQDDIKRILAYSTLSQLGYMVLAVGVGAPGAAMFHLSTHACFKACLFLGAGSIIHQLHEEQDIWKMGGLWNRLPLTCSTFFISALALAGLIPTSGFYSKDFILDIAAGKGFFFLSGIGYLAAAFTAFYMFRLMTVAFLGKPRTEAASQGKESRTVMTVPLLILAAFALGAGWPLWHWESFYLFATGGYQQAVLYPHPTFTLLLSLSCFIVGAGAAFLLYRHQETEIYRQGPMILLHRKFLVDEFYESVLLRFQQAIARIISWLDNWMIGGLLVRGTATLSSFSGEILRLFQTGNLQAYTFLFSLGTALLLYYVLSLIPS